MIVYRKSRFGLRHDELDEACRIVDAALSITMNLHYSSYLCGDYYRHEFDGGVITLQNNRDEETGELEFEEYSGYPLILTVTITIDDAWVQAAFRDNPKIDLLERSVTEFPDAADP